jgi:hypothetical protein
MYKKLFVPKHGMKEERKERTNWKNLVKMEGQA